MMLEWEPWYAWYPVRINSRWYFRETVYRRYRLSIVGKGGWIYGDTFNMLKED